MWTLIEIAVVIWIFIHFGFLMGLGILILIVMGLLFLGGLLGLAQIFLG